MSFNNINPKASPDNSQSEQITIHPTAIIEKGAYLEKGVVIGPYCIVGPNVHLEEGVELLSHVTLSGRTRIGAFTKIYPFASIGYEPQDLKYHGEDSTLIIGSHNTIREYATMHPGTEGGGMVTKVGSHGLFMVSTHIAHDCHVGDRVIMSNHATLGGHVIVGNDVIIGGLSAVRQFVRIGDGAFIGGMCGIANDIVPYGLVTGEKAELCGINIVGMKRKNISRSSIQKIQEFYEHLFLDDSIPFNEKINQFKENWKGNVELLSFINFFSSQTIVQYSAFKKM